MTSNHKKKSVEKGRELGQPTYQVVAVAERNRKRKEGLTVRS